MVRDKTTVAVLGGGNGAFATAGILKLKGLTVHLLEAPEFAHDTLPQVQEQGGIEVLGAEVAGLSSGFAALDVVTDDPARALDGADVILYVVPAFAERHFTEMCAPYFHSQQAVLLFCGNFGGALELASQLSSSGVRDRPIIGETEGLAFTGFKENATTVKVSGRKAGLACAALPSSDMDRVLARLKPIASRGVTIGKELRTP